MEGGAVAGTMPAEAPATVLRTLGRRPYAEVLEAMRAFTASRTEATPDEIWLVEHEPVFTQGLAGQEGHLLAPGDIPVVRTERGGQVTYHGPGQVVAYPLLDLRRRGYFVKEYVFRIEAALLDTLADAGITGHRVRGAPGIYVRLADPFGHAALPPVPPGADPMRGLGKIAALGIKVSRHCTFHGLALNVAMDLEPFGRINPCGYAGLRTVDLATLGVAASWDAVAQVLGAHLLRRLAP
ncbi:MAG: lipoyl(octanoyl) transferase [Pseudomonadota bacterium]